MILQVGVKVFLKNDKGKYLLLCRSPIKYPNVSGRWDIVGGRINPGSQLIQNLKREVMEETKLDIVGEPILIHAQDIIPNDEKHVVRLTYAGATVGEPVLDTSETVAHRWVSLKEMRDMPDLDIYVREILENGRLAQLA